MNCTTCGTCGAQMPAPRRGTAPFHCGLDVLLEGVLISRCPSCGEEEVGIPAMEGLIRTLTDLVSNRPGRLTPAEIRFLRKSIGWAGKDFAHQFGVSPETVSRWERGHRAMPRPGELLLRVLARTVKRVERYDLPDLDQQRSPDPMRLTPTGLTWEQAA